MCNCENKKCRTCEYFGWDDFGRAHVCVNGDSENVADFVSDDDTCEHYQKKNIDGMSIIDLDGMNKWIQHQKECVKNNSECYTDIKDVLNLLDIVEEYVMESSFELNNIIHNKKCACQESESKSICMIDVKTMILNMMNAKGTLKITVEEYIKIMKFLYVELYKRDMLKDYKIFFDINSGHLQNVVLAYNDWFELGLDDNEIMLKKNINIEKLLNSYSTDETITLLLNNFYYWNQKGDTV